jgi:TatD DNase family protein
MIDSHCHLDFAEYANDRGQVLARARGAGITAFVCIGSGKDTVSAREAVALAAAEPDIWAAVGVHPHDVARMSEADWSELEGLARAPRVVGIGETGLDYHYDHSPRDTQRDVFARLIGLARELRKPIVVHTREAAVDTLALLESEGARDVGGIIHCFSEDQPFARRALDLGFDISLSGIVTFKNARAVQDVAMWAPLDRLLVETDSPYLAPMPLRGKRCEPEMIVHTARRVAELRGISAQELAAATRANTERRFGKAFGPPAVQRATQRNPT